MKSSAEYRMKLPAEMTLAAELARTRRLLERRLPAPRLPRRGQARPSEARR